MVLTLRSHSVEGIRDALLELGLREDVVGGRFPLHVPRFASAWVHRPVTEYAMIVLEDEYKRAVTGKPWIPLS